jgi:hypothetical protein
VKTEIPTRDGIPVRESDAIKFVCAVFDVLEGHQGTIVDIVRKLGFEDRNFNDNPTRHYLRVRGILRAAKRAGRVEQHGRSWVRSQKLSRAS